jgi:membrane protease YdiL (CAAX protease family)
MMPSMTPGDHDYQTPQIDPTQAAPVRAIPFARPFAVEGACEPTPAAGGLVTDALEAAWPPRMSRLRAIVELLVLVPAGVIGSVSVIAPFSVTKLVDNRWYNVLGSVGPGIGTLTACAIMLLISRQRPASIGLTRRNWLANIGLGVAALVAFYAFVVIPLSISFPQLAKQGEYTRQDIERTFPPMNFAWIALMMTFVVLWEEVVFRGFVLTRMRVIFGRWWLSILIGSIVFGAIHFSYQGVLAVVMIALLAVLMGVVFAWRRSIIPSMTLHWLFNVGTLLAIKYLFKTWK